MKFQTIIFTLTTALLVVLVVLVACQSTEKEQTGLTVMETTPVDVTATAVSMTAVSSEPIASATATATAVVAETDAAEAIETAVPPTPTAPKPINICIANEPSSLYLYSGDGDVLRSVFYDSLYTHNAYEYQAWGLEKLPNLADGDAIIGERRVDEGDRIINADGRIVTLTYGTHLFDKNGELVTFEGDPITMAQMKVTFKLRRMVWSDGTAVTAADSLFSFNIAADPDSTVPKERVSKTAVYEPIDDFTIRWTGLPGWLDPTYFLNIWQPLPAHQLDQYSAAELREADETTRHPLANGAFMLDEWREGDLIRFVKNPYYYRANEGLPRLTSVTFHISQTAVEALAALQSGACDIALDDNFATTDLPALLEMAESGSIIPHITDALIFEQISLGVAPSAEYAKLHPNWFAQVEARRAVAYCLDREAMVDEILFGQGAVMDSYVSTSYPTAELATDGFPYTRDLAIADERLTMLNYIDRDGDGIREDIDGNPLAININVPAESVSRVRLAEMFADNLADCGISVTVAPLPAASFYTEGEEGPIFGRNFDAALFAWQLPSEPACHLYTEEAIGRVNVTGWAEPLGLFDEACRDGRHAFVGDSTYNAAHQAAMELYASNLPSIPLFSRLRIAAVTPRVQNFTINTTQSAPLWNIAEIDNEQ